MKQNKSTWKIVANQDYIYVALSNINLQRRKSNSMITYIYLTLHDLSIVHANSTLQVLT